MCIFCLSQDDMNFSKSCISEFNNLDGYIQVLQSADPNRVSHYLTINSMELTTAHFLSEIVSTICVEIMPSYGYQLVFQVLPFMMDHKL